jgi:bifunctional ADP-heptose synthase (sugar kinase/adenylyltransferase)
MDTRSKILTLAEAASLAGPLAMVTGYFDVLRAAHIRDLDRVRRREHGAKLLAVVLPAPGEILSQRARAELVAALRVIDYVVIADDAAARRLAHSLEPVEIVHLETADACRARELKEHVHRRQT